MKALFACLLVAVLAIVSVPVANAQVVVDIGHRHHRHHRHHHHRHPYRR